MVKKEASAEQQDRPDWQLLLFLREKYSSFMTRCEKSIQILWH